MVLVTWLLTWNDTGVLFYSWYMYVINSVNWFMAKSNRTAAAVTLVLDCVKTIAWNETNHHNGNNLCYAPYKDKIIYIYLSLD